MKHEIAPSSLEGAKCHVMESAVWEEMVGGL